MTDKDKVNEMFKILANRGINAEALHKALRAFKDKYPHVKKFHVVYYYIEALKSAERLGMQAFMRRDKKYPCPFNEHNENFKCRKGKTCKEKCMFMAY